MLSRVVQTHKSILPLRCIRLRQADRRPEGPLLRRKLVQFQQKSYALQSHESLLRLCFRATHSRSKDQLLSPPPIAKRTAGQVNPLAHRHSREAAWKRLILPSRRLLHQRWPEHFPKRGADEQRRGMHPSRLQLHVATGQRPTSRRAQIRRQCSYPISTEADVFQQRSNPQDGLRAAIGRTVVLLFTVSCRTVNHGLYLPFIALVRCCSSSRLRRRPRRPHNGRIGELTVFGLCGAQALTCQDVRKDSAIDLYQFKQRCLRTK